MRTRLDRIQSGFVLLGLVLAIPLALGVLLVAVLIRLIDAALAAALYPLGAG